MRKHSWSKMISWAVTLFTLLIVCLGFSTSVYATIGYSNPPGALIQFNGDGTFSFTPATNNFQVTQGSAEDLFGDMTGTFTIGDVTTVYVDTIGDISTAPITGTGTLVVHDGAIDFTATMDWVGILQLGTLGGLNIEGAINLTGITYSGTNADLLAMKTAGSGINVLAFQDLPVVPLATLKNTVYSSGFSGAMAPGAPPCNCTVTFTSPSIVTNYAGDSVPDVTAIQTCDSGTSNSVTVTLQGAITNGSAPTIIIRTNTATDDCGTVYTFVQTIVTENSPLLVDAGTNQSVTLGQPATLHGTVTDDDLPPGGSLSSEWTLVSGPGAVILSDTLDPVTGVTFSGAGVYVFRLSGSDTVVTNSDETTVTVVAANHAPVVTLLPKQLVVLPNSIALNASVVDDGLPTGSVLTFAWSKSSGPGDVTFADSASTNTTATFSQPGDYVLRFTADDSELSGFAETLVAVRTPAMNEAPVANAGPAKVVGLTNVVTLGGAAYDDGLPLGSSVTVAWSKVSGPGNVSFVDGSVTNAQAAFSAEGQYVLRLTASDSEKSASADVQVTVHLHNQPPIADAGEDQTVTIPDPARLSSSGQPMDAGTELSTSISAAPHWNNAIGQPGLNASVNEDALSLANGMLYAGSYTSDGFLLNSTNIGVVARWDGTNWGGLYSSLPAYSNGPPFGYMTIPYTQSAGAKLIAHGNEVFVSGGFLRDLGNDGFNDWSARWDGTAWRPWQVASVGSFVSFAQFLSHQDSIYMAGLVDFQATNWTQAFNNGTGIPGLPVFHDLARWDGTNWFGVFTNFNASISAAAFGPDNKLYVGGSFYMSTPTGIATNIAIWDGTNWAPMAEGLIRIAYNIYGEPIDATSIRSIVADDAGNIYVGGVIGQAGNVPVNNIARWDGHHWFALGDASQNGTFGPVFAMVAHGHDIYAGGDFNFVGGQAARSIARWDGEVWWPLGAGNTNGANFRVWSLALATNGLYLAGEFDEAGGTTAHHVAFWEFPEEPLRGVVLNGHVSDDGLPNGSLSAQWQQISGPGTATFANPTSAVTAVTFDLPGTYVLRLTANDSELTALDETTITVHANEPPIVNAGADATISLGKDLVLAGSVSDDGLPDGSTVATVWRQVSGPGTATFQNRANTNTTVTFDHAGTYILRLYANDSQFTASDSMIVTVSPQNSAPSVSISADTTTIFPAVQLNATVSDDGLPTGTLVETWSQVSGPASVFFHDATAPSTQAIFPQPGTYVLRLTVSDTELSSSAEITITVTDPLDLFSPWIWAGNDQHIALPSVASLQGLAFWEKSVTVGWWVKSGPGTVTFGDANSAETTASFSQSGVYQLYFYALLDGVLYAIDDLTVFVDPPTGVNRAPQVSAGPPKTGVVNSPLNLDGVVTDDGLPTNSTATAQWSVLSGPGAAVFANSNSPQTTVTCDTTGDYVFQLTASDSELSSSNTVAVRIVSGSNLPPTVNAGTDAVVVLPNFYVLNGSVSDDGLPSGVLSYNWSVISGPTSLDHPENGVNFDPSRLDTGLGFPSPGTYVLRLTASDGALTNADDVTITVLPETNAAPRAFAGLNQVVNLGDTVQLAGMVWDDGNPVGAGLTSEWFLIQGPGDVTFSDTSATNATATFTKFGTYLLGLSVSDTVASDSSYVAISVTEQANGNQAPVISVSPSIAATTFRSINLPSVATDDGLPTGSHLTTMWSQISGPSTVRFGNALQTNSPVTFLSAGTYTLRLIASDSKFTSSSNVVVIVTDPTNEPPVAFAGPNLTVTRPEPAELDGVVVDDDLPMGSSLTYQWSKVSGPGTVTFVANGGTNVDATPWLSPDFVDAVASATFGANGTYVLRLTASDTEFTNTDDITVTALPGVNTAPHVNAGPDQAVSLPYPAILHTEATDDGLENGALQITWSKVSGPGSVSFSTINGVYQAAFTATGTYVLRLTAFDGALSTSDDVTVTVYDTPGPIAEIDSPADGGIVTAPTNIIGTASSAILQSYVIEYRLAPSPSDAARVDSETNWATLATGSSSVTSNALAVFDPTLLLNGLYQLRLTAIDAAGRSATTEPISVIVDRNLKIGQFTISFNDLTVPVPGLPVQIVRTYDSRAAAAGVQGDFGLGWTLDLHNVRLQKNRLLSTGWQEYTTGDPFDLSLAYHLDQGSPRIVSITFPDGRVEKFQFLPNPMDQPLAPIEYPQWRFVPIGNTRGTLVPAGFDDSDGHFLVFTGSIPGPGELDDLNFFSDWLLDATGTNSVADLDRYPTLFRYSSPEGYQYLIDEVEGLKSVTDPNGNTLVISTNGFTWSNPTAGTNDLNIAFQRDAAGRITNIVDAAGNAMSYAYSTNGDLVKFTDRVGQTNGFAYTNSTFIHYLTGIFDSRGTNVLQNHFDQSGRIVATTDAIGNSTYFGYDPMNYRETTTNRLGYVTINDYDKLGRLIHKIDAVGLETAYDYDDFDNLLSISNGACSCATHYTYDSDNNLISEADELGRTVHYTYTSLLKVLTYTDSEENSTTNSYDSRGNLLSTRDPLGNVTSFTYNEQGKVISMTDPRGGVTSFDYDTDGRLINETNALGNFTHYTVDANGNLTSTTRRRALDFTPPIAALYGGNKEAKLCDSTNVTNYKFIVPTYTYDNGGHLIAILLPDGVTVCSNNYDGNGHVTDSQDQAGQHTITEYNGLGKPARITYPDGTSESMGYDAEGQLTGHNDRGGRHTQFAYDPDGRLTEVTYPDGRTVSAVYNSRGQLVEEIDSCHGTNTYDYDAVGNRTASTDPEGHITRYTYNDKRACTSITDPLGHITSMDYDALNRNTRIVYPNGKVKTAVYSGRMVTGIIDEDGKTNSFGYDAIGQLINTTNSTADVMRYQYDEVGNRVMETDPHLETTVHEYDDLGRRIRTTKPDGSAQQFGYDALGRLISSVDPAGGVSSYGYSPRNTLIATTNALGQVTQFTYNTLGQRTSRVDPNGQVTQWHYDTSGRLTGTTFPNGSTTTTEYDGCSRISAIIDTAGGRTSYAYNFLDQVTSTTDPLTRTTAFGYDDAGNLITQQDPAGQITQFLYDSLNRKTGMVLPDGTMVGQAYDPRGHLASITDQLGNSTQYAYDANGRLSTLTDALGHSTGYSYDSRGNLTGVTDALGHSTTYVYDQNDQLAQTLYADGSSTMTTYDSRGLVVSRSDQLHHETLYGYDNLGRLTSITNALGYVTSYGYDLVGRLATETDANGHTTTYQYDTVGNLTNTIYADGNSVSTTYDLARRAVSDTDERGNTTRYGYNVIGQLVSTTNALDEVTTFAYDNLGRQTQAVDALGHVTRFEYDPVGHLTHTLYADGTARTNIFDPAGRRVATVDEAGVTNWFGYDALGRLISVTNALGSVTAYNYDAAGRLLSQTDARNHTTTYDYDVMNRRISRTLPGGESESFAYDAAGDLTNRVDFNGRNCVYQYDPLNRPVQKSADPFFGEPPVTWSYDRVGLRTNMTDASGATAYKYDSRYRLTQKSRTWSDAGVSATLAYAYDSAGNLTNVISSSVNGVVLGYGYDALNRLGVVQDVFNGTSAYAYDHAGNLSALTRPNGLQTIYDYDTRNRATNVTTIDASLAVLSKYLYSYGPIGNRLGATETVVVGGLTNALARTYAYDPLYRLTNETIIGSPVSGAAGYTYDAVGNRLTRASTLPGLPNQTFTYTANDQPTSDTYDANGNTIAATVPDPYTGTPVSAADTYDHADRLIHRATTLNSQSATIAYQYDGDGNRVGKTVGGVTTHFVVDEANPTGWPQVLEELSAPSSQLSTLAVTRIYSFGYGPLSQDQLTGNTWAVANFGHDAHGNVRYVTDSAGHATDTFDYDAFGSLLQRSGSTTATRLFTGEELDPELGLYNLRARYHNPATGRFWTRDSFEGYLASPASRHGYAYTLNNPLNMVDPSGHEGLAELSAVGAIAPDASRAVDSIWSGVFHYLNGIAGGAAAGADGHAVLAANGQEGMFIQGLSQHAGINIGRDNFFATMRGAPFLLAANPYVFVSDNPCFQYQVLHFDASAPIWGPANLNPVFPEWRSQLLDDLIDIGHGSFIGADLRRWAAQQAALGSQGSGTAGLWANLGYNVRAELANAGAGLISPTSWKEGVEQLQERAEQRMSQEVLKGNGDAYSQYIGWSSIAGDLIGVNGVLEGTYGGDLATGEQLSAEDRWRRGPMGVSQLAGTVGVPLAGSIDAQLAKLNAVQTLNRARQAVQEQEAVISQQVAQDPSEIANASRGATSTPKPCVAPENAKALALHQDQIIVNNYMRYYNDAWLQTVKRFNAGEITIPEGQSWQTVLGQYTDAAARARLRNFLTAQGIPEGPGMDVLVNRWLRDPSGSGAYRIPDVRLRQTGTILDGTIGTKTLNTPQIQDLINFSGGNNVIIVRPTVGPVP